MKNIQKTITYLKIIYTSSERSKSRSTNICSSRQTRTITKKFFEMNLLQNAPAFALLYALMYVLLFMLTIALISSVMLSATRQTKINKGSIQAYRAAQSGIEDGIYQIYHGTHVGQTCYLKDGASDCAGGVTDKSQGYYVLSFDGDTIKATGYAPWLGPFGKSELKVTLQATKQANGYYITQQIGG